MSAPRYGGTLSRRRFLTRLASLSAAAWATPLWVPGYRQAMARTLGSVVSPAGTTLERSIVTSGPGPYFRLTYGPGWPIEVRTALAEPKRGREDRRVAVATILHFTDFQFPDAQSPARVEFLDRFADEPFTDLLSGSFRPHEALVVHASEAAVRQANAIGRGPVTGRPYDCCVSTGDNFDNKQVNELRWFLELMNGRRTAANSGAADAFEGVQSFDDPVTYDPHYYHPEDVSGLLGPDIYKQTYGFPDYPGLLDAAIRPFDAEGLGTPWYSAYGNHDALAQGNSPSNPVLDELVVGSLKILHPPPGMSASDLWRGLVEQDPATVAAISLAPATEVTPDPERRFLTGREYVERHLAEPATPGPTGHGFTEANLESATLYYTFDVAPGVLGITLDTTGPWYAGGSITTSQLEWLEQRLIEAHSRYLEPDGTEVRTGNDDVLVIVFSHHRAASMQYPAQGPDEEGRVEQRHTAAPLEETLHRFPNVIAWVNGHSHYNRIGPRPDPRTGGYWDITTAAQIDPPQQARIIEIVDNRDGTLSIFTTVFDHSAPASTAVGAYDLEGLAAISRELSYNDYQVDVANLVGEPTDLNTELVIAAPFDLTPDPARPAEEAVPEAAVATPATGGDSAVPLGIAAAGAAVGAAVALRRRGTSVLGRSTTTS